MKNSAQKGNTFLIILICAAIIIGAVIFFTSGFQKSNRLTSSSPTPDSTQATSDNLKNYTSNDLKISFSFPKDWYIDEKDYEIMITSYSTRIGENKEPDDGQIKIFINSYSGCYPSLEKDLINPACGQGEEKNKIVSKDVRQTAGGEFLKYTLDSYDENQRVQYFFQKGKKMLDIEKHPDPSQFETEFNQIIDSIRFLP